MVRRLRMTLKILSRLTLIYIPLYISFYDGRAECELVGNVDSCNEDHLLNVENNILEIQVLVIEYLYN